MREQQLQGEEAEVCPIISTPLGNVMIINGGSFPFQLRKKIQEKAKDGTLKVNSSSSSSSSSANGDASSKAMMAAEPKKRGRWDQTVEESFVPPKKLSVPATPTWGDAEVGGVLILSCF